MITHVATYPLMDNATNIGGIAFIKKPILGINSVKNARAPHTNAPGIPNKFKKTVTITALVKPPIRLDLIQPFIITDICENAMVALSLWVGGNTCKYNSNNG